MSIKLSNSSSRLRFRGGCPDGYFSCSASFRLDTDPNAIQTLIAIGGNNAGTDWHDASAIVVRTLSDGTTLELRCFGSQMIYGPSLTVGEWVRISVVGHTRPGRDIYYFINGALYGSQNSPNSGLFFPEVIELGNSSSGQYFRGAIAGWKIWETLLSNTKIIRESNYRSWIDPGYLYQAADFPTLTDTGPYGRDFETPSSTSTESDPPMDRINNLITWP